MKKQFIFTKDTSFTHLKDEMYDSETEHIIKDDQTEKLYHHIVEHGSGFEISYESVFMSHLLKEIGLTGFGKSYGADACKIDLPWYPKHYSTSRKFVVELPESAKLEDFEFGAKKDFLCEQFKQTSIGKTFDFKKGQEKFSFLGKDVLGKLLGFSPIQLGYFKREKGIYPFFTVLKSQSLFESGQGESVCKMLDCLDPREHEEIYSVLKKFANLDLKKEIGVFEQEIGKRVKELPSDLLLRQTLIRKHLLAKQKEIKTETYKQL